jgi:hypothetical protein
LPDEFYESMYRLRGWDYEQSTTARPAIVGKFTPDLVYARLAPGVPERLKLEPKDKGRRKHHPHRRCTGDVGHPALKKRSFAVNASMRANANWGTFSMFLSRADLAPLRRLAHIRAGRGFNLRRFHFGASIDGTFSLASARLQRSFHLGMARQARRGTPEIADHRLSWHISSAR